MDTVGTELDVFATGSAMVGTGEASFPELECSRRGKGLVKISNDINTATVSGNTTLHMRNFHLTVFETVCTLDGFSGGKYSTTYIEIKVQSTMRWDKRKT